MPGPRPEGHNLGGSQWSYLPPYGVGQPGSTVVGGGGGVPEPYFRDLADARRSMYRRTPQAEYPDGYLGTIQSRTSDKFLDQMKSRLGERQYQRGVHKGERIDAADYFWPPEFQPTNGLEAEVEGRRQAPLYVAAEIQPREEILPATGARLVQTLNPRRQEQLRRLAPTWRW